LRRVLVAVAGLLPVIGGASEVWLTPDRAHVDVLVAGKPVRIERIPDQDHVLTGTFAATSRKCPPFCINPMQLAPGVTTVGELELFDFIETKVNQGSGVMIDARTPAWHARGTIPGSTNIPFTTLSLPQDAAELTTALAALGVRPARPTLGSSIERALTGLAAGAAEVPTRWDLSAAKDVLVWCNGPWSDQSPRAIRALLELGLPAEKLFWYRGGMQLWQILGLTTSGPEAQGPQPAW
jgi:rhodanese-related sulfurtransferase